jgi:hypothetical protein
MDDEDDLKTYKKKNVRELDEIFHANGWISAGGVSASSDSYKNSPCWCACGRLKSVGDLCARCAEKAP